MRRLRVFTQPRPIPVGQENALHVRYALKSGHMHFAGLHCDFHVALRQDNGCLGSMQISDRTGYISYDFVCVKAQIGGLRASIDTE